MGRRNKILVPEAREALNQLKDKFMEPKGYNIKAQSENVKYEVAMVKEMVKMDQEQFSKK